MLSLGLLNWYYRAAGFLLHFVMGVLNARALEYGFLPTGALRLSLFSFRLAQFCFELCRNVETKYMMLLDGDLCGCGDIKGFLSLDNEATSCDVQCVGGDGNSCGGVAELDVFKTFFYGASTKVQSPAALCFV